MKIGAYKELIHLLGLPAPDGEQLRRIAEVAELLYDIEAARPWWLKAALVGDQDAIDYMAVLNEEEAADGHGEVGT